MTIHRLSSTGLFLASLALLPACASTGTPEPVRPTSAEGLSTAELEALYRARHDSTLLEVSDADVDFMIGMIGHHAQALVMSAWAPEAGASPQIRTLTSRIINAQTDEIAVMQTWLRDRGKPVPEVSPEGHLTGHGEHMHMPGMLSAEQMDELSRAKGGEFDRLFLTYMIQHHEGAVTMVHELFASDGAAQDELIFKLASDIQVDQTTEVKRMQDMLEGLPSSRNR